MENNILVSVVMGSPSDLPVMKETSAILEKFEIPHEVRILSAHRTPDATSEYAKNLEGRGAEVVIAGAGMAAHLAGVIASETVLPIISAPMQGSALNGLDALYSIVQMPPGVPVASMAIGKAGAKNAALMAIQILGVKFPEIREAFRKYKREMGKKVLVEDQKLQELGCEEYLNQKS